VKPVRQAVQRRPGGVLADEPDEGPPVGQRLTSGVAGGAGRAAASPEVRRRRAGPPAGERRPVPSLPSGPVREEPRPGLRCLTK